MVCAREQVLEPLPQIGEGHHLFRRGIRTGAGQMLELHRVVEIEHGTPAEPRQERERETESLRDEDIGAVQRRAQIARNAEGLLPERLRAFGDERDLVARGEATRELHRPDAGAGHLRPHHVLAVPDHLHRASHSSASR